MTEVEDNIIEIQTKLSFAEESIEQLNDVIVSQQKMLDKLTRKIQLLDKKIEDESQQWQQTNPVDETPPHY